MTHPRPYRPSSTRPHPYGVRHWSCPAIATEPCRPTACVRERPCSPNGESGLGETPSYRASAPNGAGDVGSRSTVHCSLLTVHWTFTFSAKERDSETGLSYFGSRYYSSNLSIWLSVDPMSDKYASLSPYVYCADNPVKLVDPNGEDYEVVVEGTTITIRAVYYTASENKAELQQGLDAWNAQSGVYSYETGKGDNKKTYTINFELTVADGEYNTTTASSAFNNDESGFANFVESSTEIYNKNGEPINGEASNNVVHFRPEASTRTMSHEIGHTLGIGDWGLPGPDQEDFGQLMTSGGTSDVINKSHIATILSVKGYRSPSFHSGFTINPSKGFKMETTKAIGIIKKL